MIDGIHVRLNTWADWVALGRRITGLGYPTKAAFYTAGGTGGGLLSPMVNEDAMLIEKAIHAALPEDNLRRAIEQFYLRAGTASTHAQTLGCSRDTLYARIHRAHEKIAKWLHENR